MSYEYHDHVPVWGDVDVKAIEQIQGVFPEADAAAIMADGHLGYSVPIGGVVAYANHISPSGVGFDIACGNKAALLDADATWAMANISPNNY